MAVALLCSWIVLERDMRDHNILRPRADIVILLLAGAGIVGSRLYHELETPANLFNHPFIIFNFTQGHAWFGGFLAGIATLFFLARQYKFSILTMMDLVSPSATLGYAIGRLGCFLAGDGCYGASTSLPWGVSFPHGLVPTYDYVHPIPIYEFTVGVAIFLYLRHVSAYPRPTGWVFAQYLLLTGMARFLVEFIRINPRIFYGFTNAQLVSLLCLILGMSLLMRIRFLRFRPGFT